MKKNVSTIIWIFFFIIGFSVSGYSATDIVLHLTDIEGESKINGYEDWIDVLGWSWELNNSNDNSPRNPTNIYISPIILEKYVDKSSPELVFKLLTGEIINEAIVVFRKAGEVPVDYVRITLSNVKVIYLSPSLDSGDDRLIETLGLDFKNICYEYTPIKEDGSADAAIERCWSR